jgi:tRNA threonylcarbamoyladenosine biosynthesis protein TsaE
MRLADESATLLAGRKLSSKLRAGDVITMSGALSAGKTTFARGLLAGLGHKGEVPSPSFAIVQPYDELDPPVWHVDLYRIEEPQDLDELGIDDIRSRGALVIEWPEHAAPDAWPDALALSFEALDDGSRRLTARVPKAWEGRWPFP